MAEPNPPIVIRFGAGLDNRSFETELADDVRALSTLVHSLRTALINVGLIKGAA
jgi:hypothetical protein